MNMLEYIKCIDPEKSCVRAIYKGDVPAIDGAPASLVFVRSRDDIVSFIVKDSDIHMSGGGECYVRVDSICPADEHSTVSSLAYVRIKGIPVNGSAAVLDVSALGSWPRLTPPLTPVMGAALDG